MPDHPADRADREPLPFRPAAAGCVFGVHVHAGQWGTCGGRPAVTGVWTSPRTRERWRVFACAVYADRLVDDPECRDVGPLDDAAAVELDDRRAPLGCRPGREGLVPAGADGTARVQCL